MSCSRVLHCSLYYLVVIVFDVTELVIRSNVVGNTQAFKRASVCGKVRRGQKIEISRTPYKAQVDLYNICASTLQLARLSMDRPKNEVNGDLRSNKENTL